MLRSKFIIILLLLFLTTQFCFAGGSKKLYINDHKIPCAGSFECMQVKEKAKGQWHVYSDTIAGFNYEEGYNYVIKVAVSVPKNTYAGELNDKYRLVKVVSKIKTSYNPSVKLEGKKWLVVVMNDGKTRLKLNKDSTMSMQLNLKENKMTGHGICNGIFGALKVQGNTLQVSSISATKMYCIGDGSKLEAIYRDFLGKLWTYRVDGNTLYLHSADGADMIFEGN